MIHPVLEELLIRHYALIEDMRIRFNDGFTVLTGETGAGKSIVIEALGLLLGSRASASQIRQGADHCYVHAIFSVDHAAEIHGFAKRIGITVEDSSLIIRREITSSGKSRCYINDCPVNLGTVLNLGELLVDLHGQHEHQSLFNVARQRALLDRYGFLEEKREKFTVLYNEYQELVEKRDATAINEQERMRRIDLYRFQRDEIERAQLQAGEDEELESRLPRLKHAEKLSQLIAQAHECLSNNEYTIRDQLIKLNDRLRSINAIVAEFNDTMAMVEGMYIPLEEITGRIDDFRKSLDHDPGVLDQLLGRQEMIDRLKKKYGATIAEIKDFQSRIKHELDVLEHFDESQEALIKEIGEKKEMLFRAGNQLSVQRKKTAAAYESAVQKEIRHLGMPGAVFSIRIQQQHDEQHEPAIHSSGLDAVEFLVSANPGQPPLPIRQVASGGEISRMMLALKSVAAEKDDVPTLIFDEIDAGIGGSMAGVVGDRLASLSGHRQVIVITHLPQIASRADTHYHVDKDNTAHRTRTRITLLSSEERTREIASMLGGREVTKVGLQHAGEMLKKSGEREKSEKA